jgi:hypothetical protein
MLRMRKSASASLSLSRARLAKDLIFENSLPKSQTRPLFDCSLWPATSGSVPHRRVPCWCLERGGQGFGKEFSYGNRRFCASFEEACKGVPWSARMPLFEIYEDPEKGMTVRRGTAASSDIDVSATSAGTFRKHLPSIPHLANAKHRSSRKP